MKKMRTLLGLALAVGAALSLTAPAFASDYSFATTAPQDYYGSTSYEDVYGSQYNYGGRNAADYDVPELEYGRMSTTQTGIMERTILPGLQGTVVGDSGSYGIGGEGTGPSPSWSSTAPAAPARLSRPPYPPSSSQFTPACPAWPGRMAASAPCPSPSWASV